MPMALWLSMTTSVISAHCVLEAKGQLRVEEYAEQLGC